MVGFLGGIASGPKGRLSYSLLFSGCFDKEVALDPQNETSPIFFLYINDTPQL